MDFFEIMPGHFINLRQATRIIIYEDSEAIRVCFESGGFGEYILQPERIQALKRILSSQSTSSLAETLIQFLANFLGHQAPKD